MYNINEKLKEIGDNGEYRGDIISSIQSTKTSDSDVINLSEDLAKKLSSLCPACSSPGFATVEHIRGLRCAGCYAPTNEMSAEILGCVKCDYRLTRERTDQQFADPARCNFCNP